MSEVKASDTVSTSYTEYGGGNNLIPIIYAAILLGIDIHLVAVVVSVLSKGFKYGGVNAKAHHTPEDSKKYAKDREDEDVSEDHSEKSSDK